MRPKVCIPLILFKYLQEFIFHPLVQQMFQYLMVAVIFLYKVRGSAAGVIHLHIAVLWSGLLHASGGAGV